MTPEFQNSLVWIDESGKETPVALPKGAVLSGRISPDSDQALVSYFYPGRQVELIDLARGARRNVTFEMNPIWAIWGPGPARATFTSNHEGPPRIYSRRIDAGPEEVETPWNGTGRELGLGSWSRDGSSIYDLGRGPNSNRAVRFRVGGTASGDGLSLGRPARIPGEREGAAWPGHFWDVSTDGRILAARGPNETDSRAWIGRTSPTGSASTSAASRRSSRGPGRRSGPAGQAAAAVKPRVRSVMLGTVPGRPDRGALPQHRDQGTSGQAGGP